MPIYWKRTNDRFKDKPFSTEGICTLTNSPKKGIISSLKLTIKYFISVLLILAIPRSNNYPSFIEYEVSQKNLLKTLDLISKRLLGESGSYNVLGENVHHNTQNVRKRSEYNSNSRYTWGEHSDTEPYTYGGIYNNIDTSERNYKT
ncbi:hypothetical protein MKS88_005242 [Plasmodium brasilianum]|uniref:Uncharacterized protein n=2 Tax=Plasmodium (Plasmodium) TaxID=418103 RepID=A0A1A8X072_PLAMA|nr:conserved Plasmodium protein, unknown function [Plasmodium malariae]KAI4834568.1 hypothetical protein MKS88_005242 [Plasmodium brasilianum]SBS97074.1 Plasmodium exported protein, unknown function [Plasmodium malariae]SCP03105.1 conserved Plasmodium protein, unknown function [Plasmodium malariae]